MTEEGHYFTIFHLLRVLYDNSQKKLTLDEISKKAGKDHTILQTEYINKLMDNIEKHRGRGNINSFELDTKTTYQITSEGISYLEYLPDFFEHTDQKEKARKTNISREEYKKLNRREKRKWGPVGQAMPGESLYGYRRLQRWEIKRNRSKWKGIWVIIAIAIVFALVALFLTLG